MDLKYFNEINSYEAGRKFFIETLGKPLKQVKTGKLDIQNFLKDQIKTESAFEKVTTGYFLGAFAGDGLFGSETTDFETASNSKEYNDFLIFLIEVNNREYLNRSEIAKITRAFNRKAKDKPVILLSVYYSKEKNESNTKLISLSTAERSSYENKKLAGEKVGKVNLLRDINIQSVHSGHERILLDLKEAIGKAISMNDLFLRWREIFDTSILNKKFYKEIFYWYLWASKEVEFPNLKIPVGSGRKKEKYFTDDKEIKNHTSISLIRLLTRLIFVWFLKEKKIIPNSLFEEDTLKKVLKGFSTEGKKSIFYKAILQNLFFATLNKEMNFKTSQNRYFVSDSKEEKERRKEFGVKNLYRYKDYFSIPEKDALNLFNSIPFLNGGLFECLDKDLIDDINGKPQITHYVFLDGFSREEEYSAKLPDYLFFGQEKEVDLSTELDDKKAKNCRVNSLILILQKYKFTIEENTPLEEDIALDPELLGKVFENLLAAYNPETSTTARKQTGSFYTPREIVDYMVDESLIAYFKEKLSSLTPSPSSKEKGGGWQTADKGKWEQLKKYAREMRKEPTKAEDLLWQELRNRKLDLKFRRQHAIHSFIADFICLEANLIIEVDGEIHQYQKKRDEERTKILNTLGFTVLRFTNEEILSNLDKVINKIKASLAPPPPPSPAPLPNRGGDGGGAEELDAKLRSLFTSKKENPFSPEETKKLIKSLHEIKILDPACGSGAFPMGILNRMVFLLQKLDKENKLWEKIQMEYISEETKEKISAIEKDTQTAKTISLKEAKEHALQILEEKKKEILNTFQKQLPDYARKLYLIENCIYGVDIQPIAVQISKLRFFISLIIDQKLDDNEPNRGILSLPNLETKFVAANTLIGLDLPKEEGLLSADQFQKEREEIKSIRHLYFQAKHRDEKKKLEKREKEIRRQIQNKILDKDIKKLDEILKHLEGKKLGANVLKDLNKIKEERNIHPETIHKSLQSLPKEFDPGIKKKLLELAKNLVSSESAEQIANWNPYDQNAHAEWFDPEWMFGASPPTLSKGDGAKGVFDVVIGNPPYVQLQKDGGNLAKQYENQGYETFSRMGDIYSLFYEKGFHLLKGNGVLCYITSNKWMRAGYGESTRKFFAEKTNPILLIDFGQDLMIFEHAIVHTNILLASLPSSLRNGCMGTRIESDFKIENGIASYVNDKSVNLQNLSHEAWVIGDAGTMAIKTKVEKQGKPLKDWDIQINYGIKTGYNEAFIIDGKTKKELLDKCKDKEERKRTEKILKPILRGRDTRRYYCNFADLWLINSHNGVKEKNIPPINVKKDYPTIYEYLNRKDFKPTLQDRADQGDHWTNLRNCAYIAEFEKPKIVYSEIVSEPQFYYPDF